MKAIKTEYKGLVFDSKSEAVFARALDLAGYKWKYHVGHCGHEWDFQIEYGFDDCLVEYKPSMPTTTYVTNLINSQRNDPQESILIWGNPWEVPEPLFTDTSDRFYSSRHQEPYCYVPFPIYSRTVFDGYYDWGMYCPVLACGRFSETDVAHHRGMADTFPEITLAVATKAKNYRFDLQ